MKKLQVAGDLGYFSREQLGGEGGRRDRHRAGR